MSEVARSPRSLTRVWPRRATKTLAVLLLLAPPFLLDSFWVQAGLFVMASAVAAIGLTILVGRAGLLSLGHAFFAALGGYTYLVVAGQPDLDEGLSLGLPTLLALVLAGVVPALAGLVLSPIAGRLRGIYLGLATVSLVFLVRHLLVTAEGATGGYNGRGVSQLSVLGFTFGNSSPDYVAVLGVQLEGLQRLWFAFALLLFLAMWLGHNLVASRTGRALAMVRDGETAAAAVGVDVARAKATAFVVSSAYAGVGGAMTALAFGRVAPDVYDLQLSIDFLIIIVLGGLGSVTGAVAGAALVVTLPLVLAEYSDSLPFLAAPGESGYDAATLSRIAYGVAIVVVLLFMRGGLAGAAGRLSARVGAVLGGRRRHTDADPPAAPEPGTSESPRDDAGPPVDPRPPGGTAPSDTPRPRTAR